MMNTFYDQTNRSWTIVINVGALRRVRDDTGFDLAGLAAGRGHEQLAADPVLMCDVIWAIVRPKAEADGVTKEVFEDAFAGDAIDDAWKAVIESLADFCRSPKDRDNLRAIARVSEKVADRARDMTAARLAEMEDNIAGLLEQAMSGESSTAPPRSPASETQTS